MGYSKRGSITDFWPDDTDTEFYIARSSSIADILSAVELKWPGVSLSNINIEAENIHTECLTYDLHDAGDYTDFLRISKI
jgi:hypothetical protein